MPTPHVMDEDDVDLTRWLRAGDGVLWGQGCGEPIGLVDRLVAQNAEVGGLRAFCGHTLRDVLAAPEASTLEVLSYGVLGRLGRVAAQRPVRIVPSHFSELPALFASGALPGDVALVQLAPPDADGRCSFGVEAGYIADAVAHSRVVIAEINEQMPPTRGAGVPYADLDVVVHTNRPLLTAPPARASDADAAIAEHVVALVRDGDTIQMGVGALPEAILGRLGHLTDLGVHSGVVGDAIVDLIEAGVVTGTAKPSDRGLAVIGAALGTPRLFDFLGTEESVRILSAGYTHRPDVLARIGRLVAINGAIEVDLTGQVNAEAIDGRWIGGVGGQVDFLRAAAASGGHGVVALPSRVTKTGGSRIVRRLSGPVTTARSDADVIVSEHGAAHLRGRDQKARAQALIAIADPAHRDDLTRAAIEDGLLR